MSSLPPNIYDQQRANRRNTVLVMGAFTLFFGFLGFGFDLFVLSFSLNGATLPIATFIALAVGGGLAWRSMEHGAESVLASSTAQLIDDSNPQYQQLRNVVEEMSIASGLPVPKLYVIPDLDPNAFATGKDPDHACIAVTEGLLTHLNREELQAVIAHEMSHVHNYDIRMMTVVAALIGATMLLTEYGLRVMRYGGGKRKSSSDKGGNPLLFVVWIVALVLAPFVAQFLGMAISRQREFLADASGAELTRNPLALASALEKIDAAVEPTRAIKKGTAHLCVADPLGRAVNAKEGFIPELFGTHPPIEKRITLLKAMAYQSK
jgi:heat shock protein HtpX